MNERIVRARAAARRADPEHLARLERRPTAPPPPVVPAPAAGADEGHPARCTQPQQAPVAVPATADRDGAG